MALLFLALAAAATCMGLVEPLTFSKAPQLPSTGPAPPSSAWNATILSVQDTAKIYANYTGGTKVKAVPSTRWGYVRIYQLKTGSRLFVPVLVDNLPSRGFLDRTPSHPPTADLVKLGFDVNGEVTEVMRGSYHQYCNAASALTTEHRMCFFDKQQLSSFLSEHQQKYKALVPVLAGFPSAAKDVTIEQAHQLGPVTLACHSVFFPYLIISCHSMKDVTAFLVTDADHNEYVTICHMDTSLFHPSAPALQALKLAPGEGEACHFLAQNDFIYINPFTIHVHA